MHILFELINKFQIQLTVLINIFLQGTSPPGSQPRKCRQQGKEPLLLLIFPTTTSVTRLTRKSSKLEWASPTLTIKPQITISFFYLWDRWPGPLIFFIAVNICVDSRDDSQLWLECEQFRFDSPTGFFNCWAANPNCGDGRCRRKDHLEAEFSESQWRMWMDWSPHYSPEFWRLTR